MELNSKELRAELRSINKAQAKSCSTCVSMCILNKKPYCDNTESSKTYIADIYNERCKEHDNGNNQRS